MCPVTSFLCTILFLARLGVGGRIDTHFHALPYQYIDALNTAGGDPSGFTTPNWTINDAISSMNAAGSSLGILSVSSPGVPIAGTEQPARKLARSLNQQLGNYSIDGRYQSRIGFFGVLPDFQDIDGTLEEIDFLYSQQKLCAGVTVYTSYGNKLLSDLEFSPIWAKLQSYKALIFMHPSILDITPMFIATALPQPIVDYPLATTRAAIDLVMNGTIQSHPDIDIILSHAGGTIPYVGTRAIESLGIPEVAQRVNVNLKQATNNLQRFYYDIAGSTSAAQLNGLLDFSTPSHVLFGSDFPYIPQAGIAVQLSSYTNFVETNPRGSLIAPPVLHANAVALLNKHSQGRNYI
ncbi:6-methylsalicylic acid decarboxylase [Cladobotryum mycophilum]|uniref:6-methylsalicylate decarboxylase n=1 Tax=Cladobotryum mycophilum TaxID=491253 RepID=A0ABR0T4D5_9HYPO